MLAYVSKARATWLTRRSAPGACRFIAQSIAFVYAPGREPHYESDPLMSPAEEPRRCTMEGVVTLERLPPSTPGLTDPVLRYGNVTWAGMGFEVAPGKPAAHVDAAAKRATVRDRGWNAGSSTTSPTMAAGRPPSRPVASSVGPQTDFRLTD